MKPIMFEGMSYSIRRPLGTTENECGPLPAKVEPGKGLGGSTQFTAYFRPSEAEINALREGACVEIKIHAGQMVPIAVNVDYPKEITNVTPISG